MSEKLEEEDKPTAQLCCKSEASWRIGENFISF